MAFVVELFFDTVTDDCIRRAWKALAGAGISSPILDGGHRPPYERLGGTRVVASARSAAE